ncbi:MAG: hypothetical protein ACKOWF_01615 [Chloroflexota bacterium]
MNRQESQPEKFEIRVDVLRRLAEQAMTDAEFRAAARDDLHGALAACGYRLNDDEMALVLEFRQSLADAGVDLDLAADLGIDRARQMLGI